MSTPSSGDAEPPLVDKLRQIANAKLGDPIPECLAVNNTWGTALSQLAGEAADALDQRWRPKEALPQPPAPIGDDVRVLIQDEADNVFEGYLRYDVDTRLDGKEGLHGALVHCQALGLPSEILDAPACAPQACR
jgi:hypothetical protein